MAFFEHNIPLKMPSHMHPCNKDAWEAMAIRVDRRMSLLESALAVSGLCGEDFAAAVSLLFDKSAETPLIDTMTVDEIATIAKIQAKALGPQPKRLDWPNAVVVMDAQFTTTKEWELIRHIGLGGSDAAVVMGISHFNTKQHLYHDKVGTPIQWEPDDKKSEFLFAYGHCVEPLVIETFCKRTGGVVIPETRMFQHKDFPWITANVDAVVLLPGDPMHPLGKIYFFEAKTTGFFNREAWDDNKIPPYYATQCRQYMSVFNDPRVCGTYIGCIYGNSSDCFKAKLIERDIPMEDAQVAETNFFWKGNILRHREPEAEGNAEKDTEMIRRLSGNAVPSSTPKKISTTLLQSVEQAIKISEELTVLNREVKAKTKLRDSLYTAIKDEMGTDTKAELVSADTGMKYEFSWTPTSKAVCDMERLQMAYPDVYKDVVTINPEYSRKFSCKAKKIS